MGNQDQNCPKLICAVDPNHKRRKDIPFWETQTNEPAEVQLRNEFAKRFGLEHTRQRRRVLPFVMKISRDMKPPLLYHKGIGSVKRRYWNG